ncbi:MAG TPA: glycosyltransferase family 2 protein [Xanthobacteraceae bacterium]|nr:glycosyltransferase family 2 protein [Xanthobacteraceae bacterium]
MTLLVRDNADIVATNLDFHLAMGVDHVVVTDNRSEDATRDIVLDYVGRGVATLIDEPADDYDQSAWVTRMARLAASERAADWVINSDVDEFWWPLQGDLASVFSAVPRRYGAVAAHRMNFLPMRRPARAFWRDMVWRHVVSHNGLGEPLPAKVAHRAAADVIIAEGNHAAASALLEPPDPQERIVIFHFPYRSPAQYAAKIAKGGPAVESNRKVGPDIFHVWRRHRELQRLGRLDEWYRGLPHGDDPQRDEWAATGEVVRDTRLKAFMESLERRSSERSAGGLAAEGGRN